MAYDPILLDTISALDSFNSDYTTNWEFGSNWSNVNTAFETFINKYLFPKLNETALVNVDLGNRFDWLAKEIDFIGQYSEEYVILDSVPVNLNLSKEVELMLKRNYPKMATKLYKQGIIKKQKFTLNNNDNRLNFLTLADGVKYALAAYKKKISDINVLEEKEIKAMLVDYSLNVTKDVRPVTSHDDLQNELFKALLNIQNNSEKYNESNLASGGMLGRYTTITKLNDVAILTTDEVKTYILNTDIANTFQIKGLDLTNRIISFDDLGGVYKVLTDVTIQEQNTIDVFKTYGDYQIQIGETVPAGATITFDISELTEFAGNVEEIKPQSNLYAYVFDINKLKYRRYTKDMLKEPFYNGEFDEVNYWIHYYSFKTVSPFYNSVRIGE
ncbi:MAG: phage capsid protein [Syntrophomonadaceae bacterium]|nr:phage capsid protein [Syntrophomonadaceae bacterium]